MSVVSFVIPALNEEQNIPRVMASVPTDELGRMGLRCEVVVVDNASTDRTAAIAEEHGARVITELKRGYGHAYRAGIAAASGTIVITGDADCTYPFDHAPKLIAHLVAEELDFLSTDRLGRANRFAMKRSHRYANRALSLLSRGLFRGPFRDSQSGMWVFHRSVWELLDVRSTGMGFSQEIKNEALIKGLRCGEIGIEYRTRGGQVKLNAFRDGVANVRQLLAHRRRAEWLQAGELTPPAPRPIASLGPNDISDPVKPGSSTPAAEVA